MGYGLIDNNTLSNIANAIRIKANSNANYYPSDMASAINQIKTSDGGFEYPVMLSTRSQRDNGSVINNMQGVLYLETTNQLSNLLNSDNTAHVMYEEDWGMSPCKVSVYNRQGIYNLVIATQALYVGMCPNFNSYYTGNTNNTILVVYPNGVSQPDYQAKFGEVFTNSTYNQAYIWDNKYWNNGTNCWRQILTDGYGGALYNNIAQDGSNVVYVKHGTIYGLGIDSNEYSGNDISIVEMDYMANASNVVTAYCGPYTRSMVNTYASCGAIKEAVCGRNVAYLINTYASCTGLEKAIIGPNVVEATNAYVYCSNINNVIGTASSVINAQNAFYSCYNLRRSIDFPNLVNGAGMFGYCANLIDPPSTPNLVNGYNMYYYANSLKTENVQEYLNTCTKLKDVSGMFTCGPNENSLNVLALNFPNTVTDFCNMFAGDPKYNVWDETNQVNVQHSWVSGDAVCPESTVNMRRTYASCNNLLNAIVGNNVVDMFSCYSGCNKLTEAVCGEKVVYFNNAYQGCQNLVNTACGNNVVYMAYAYYDCPNVVDAMCGPNVISMQYTYLRCYNLANAACGQNVIYMDNAYANCNNLHEPVCGDKVVYFNGAYSYCTNLNNAVCGNAVVFMANTYMYTNVKTAVCGNNVIEFNYTYQGCNNLTDAVIGPKVINACQTYNGCVNLVNAMIYNGQYGPSSGYVNCLSYTFNNCTNLNNVVMEDGIRSMYYTFNNCTNLENVVLPKNIVAMCYAFHNCVNLSSDIEIGINCNNIQNAFRNCNKIANIFIEGNGFSAIGNQYPVLHAFYRSNYTIRRNIVINNYAGYNKLVYYNFAGNMYKTNETYAEPLEVIVNGKSYNCVRCAYNISYNCYVYCTE